MDTHEVETQSSMEVQVELELEGRKGNTSSWGTTSQHPRHGWEGEKHSPQRKQQDPGKP